MSSPYSSFEALVMKGPSFRSPPKTETSDNVSESTSVGTPTQLQRSGYFSENYLVTAKIGQGSEGRVVLVQNPSEDTVPYACKEIPLSTGKHSMKADEILKTEVRALQSLRHPNIIEFKECIIEPTRIFILMEYINGVPLTKKKGSEEN